MRCCLTKYLSILIAIVTGAYLPVAAAFVTFESGQVRPLAISPNGSMLFSVNTPDNQLEVFDIKADGLVHVASVPVGMEPVAVAARNNNEVWVVNHLSDSVSIIDLSASPIRVSKTLLIGDEPRDIVFAGSGGNKAFISTAHRGQNTSYSPDNMPNNPGEITTPSIGRADIWIFDASNSNDMNAGVPLTVLTHFTDTPRALTVSPDGATVYVAGFHTGNQTTTINEGAVCNNWNAPQLFTCFNAPGGLPLPKITFGGVQAPETGLIVKYNNLLGTWQDELSRDWQSQVMFSLPDKDVFSINANSPMPYEINDFSGIGTILYNMVTNPATGKIYVSNTEAVNHVRFEGTRTNTAHSSVIGRQHETRITIIDPAANPASVDAIRTRHLNKHINYNLVPSPAGVKENSLAIPTGMAITNDGSILYLAAFGSSKIGKFNTAELENNSFVPTSANHIVLTGGGPSGLVLDENRNKLYVLTRFDNSISVVNTINNTEEKHYVLHNPEPSHVVDGRRFLYDANLTSSNGEATCGSCHVFGDLDSLAWDLGDPEGSVINNNNVLGPTGGSSDFHPMKGPMTTQSLRGLAGQGPLHWRGDRSAANSGGDPMDSIGAFKEFNVAFVGLLGREAELSTDEMNSFTSFIMDVTYPPNPNRPLSNAMTASQQRGADFFFNAPSTIGFTCNACHVVDPVAGLFGSSGMMSFEAETQDFKIAHLRNMYQKVGMFGMPAAQGIVSGDSIHMGDQIRGFGFIHDGSVDNLFRFHGSQLFSFPGGDAQRKDVEQFMHAMDTNLKPIVGQQITSSSPGSSSKINLMIDQAIAGNSDLIVKANYAGKQRGWYHTGNRNFKSDRLSEGIITEEQLKTLSVSEMTFTSVPVGSGLRMGVDRDEDGVLDADDICPAHADSMQADDDADGIGNACDVCLSRSNPDQRDSNGDGYGNMCDADLDQSGLVNSVDLGMFKSAFFSNNADADLNGDGIVNSIDLGMFKLMFFQPPGPSALVE